MKKGFIWAIPRPGGKGGTCLCPEFLAVVPTVLGVQGDDGGALLGGDQAPSVFVMAGLTAGFAAVVVLACGRFGMGMLGAGRWDQLRGGPGVAGSGASSLVTRTRIFARNSSGCLPIIFPVTIGS